MARPATASGRAPEAPTRVMLAETWDGLQDLAGWIVSEKLDGVRAFWNGRTFLSRNGNEYHPPSWFVHGLPAEALDGELWLGRGRFHECSGICRRAVPRIGGAEWKAMRYRVFDAPDCPGGLERRLERAAALVKRTEYGEPVEQVTIPDNRTLRLLLAHVEKLGGEGLIARRPGSLWRPVRSPDMLKVITRVRCEATVVGFEEGEGRCAGVMGALLVRPKGWKGDPWRVGTGFTDKQRETPPEIGTVVTIEHKGLQESGRPREPSFIGARNYE